MGRIEPANPDIAHTYASSKSIISINGSIALKNKCFCEDSIKN